MTVKEIINLLDKGCDVEIYALQADYKGFPIYEACISKCGHIQKAMSTLEVKGLDVNKDTLRIYV